MNHPVLVCLILSVFFSANQAQDSLFMTEQTETPCSSFGRAGVCDNTYEPVCASFSQYCTHSYCPKKQFNNSCLACQDILVYSYTSGSCLMTNQEEEYIFTEEYSFTQSHSSNSQSDSEDDFAQEITLSPNDLEMPLQDFDVVVYCGSERPQACTDIDNPVCVTGCLSGPCEKTVKNDCLACSDPDVWNYSPGKCKNRF